MGGGTEQGTESNLGVVDRIKSMGVSEDVP